MKIFLIKTSIVFFTILVLFKLTIGSVIKKIESNRSSKVLKIKTAPKISKFLISKCSITLDGISLTVNTVKKNIFTVCIIPHTWKKTSLKNIKVGDKINTEIDMLARYAFRAMDNLKK